jgi:hypothetical protein
MIVVFAPTRKIGSQVVRKSSGVAANARKYNSNQLPAVVLGSTQAPRF